MRQQSKINRLLLRLNRLFDFGLFHIDQPVETVLPDIRIQFRFQIKARVVHQYRKGSLFHPTDQWERWRLPLLNPHYLVCILCWMLVQFIEDLLVLGEISVRQMTAQYYTLWTSYGRFLLSVRMTCLLRRWIAITQTKPINRIAPFSLEITSRVYRWKENSKYSRNGFDNDRTCMQFWFTALLPF